MRDCLKDFFWNLDLVWFDLVSTFYYVWIWSKSLVWWVGGGWMKGTLVFIFGPNLKTKTLLRPRPKLNNNNSSSYGMLKHIPGVTIFFFNVLKTTKNVVLRMSLIVKHFATNRCLDFLFIRKILSTQAFLKLN